MSHTKSAAMTEYFSSLTDPRVDRNKLHKLLDIIVISICAVISGADGWEAIEDYGNVRKEWLGNFLELPNGIPSHDTFGRMFSIISFEEFRDCFTKWIGAVCKATDGQIVPIGGKTSGRSHNRSCGKSAIHIVSAWASDNRVVPGQTKTDEKSDEITAIPELLNLLESEGCIVTIGAMGCQKEIAGQIREKGADYVLALKGNHRNLYEDVKLFFEDAVKNDFEETDISFYETTDGGHGRIEVRKYYTTDGIGWLYGKENWKDINIIGMVISERHVGEKVSTEIRYYISSLENNAKQFGNAVRGHWEIENSVHWILDIAFREDESRIRKGNAPENFAILRHIAMNLLKQETSARGGIRAKRLKAGWDNEYLLKVLNIRNN